MINRVESFTLPGFKKKENFIVNCTSSLSRVILTVHQESCFINLHLPPIEPKTVFLCPLLYNTLKIDK